MAEETVPPREGKHSPGRQNRARLLLWSALFSWKLFWLSDEDETEFLSQPFVIIMEFSVLIWDN